MAIQWPVFQMILQVALQLRLTGLLTRPDRSGHLRFLSVALHFLYVIVKTRLDHVVRNRKANI